MSIILIVLLVIILLIFILIFTTKYLFLSKTSIELMVFGIGIILVGLVVCNITIMTGIPITFIGLCFLICGFARKNNVQ